MIDFRPVLQIIGWILCLLALSMTVPAAIDAMAGSGQWMAFIASAGITLVAGLGLVLGTRTDNRKPLSIRQAYLAAGLGWLVPCLFAALPFSLSSLDLSATDAFFEATSGITTTGSTVLSGLDTLAPGLLLWRGLLQWLGGIGIIVMALAVLPVLNIGGMQMFRVEVVSARERTAPRAARIGSTLISVYVGLTALLALALWAAGMGRFDAITHAMSTIATGGFSNYDRSMAHFDSVTMDLIVLVGMILGGMPFLLFFTLAQGDWRRVLRDQQVHWYLGLMALGSIAITLWLIDVRHFQPLTALRHAAFTVASVMTGTGLVTLDYSDWAGMPVAILFFLTFVGGCAGSTAAGIKVFRFQLLFANAVVQIRQLLRPHAVMVPSFNNKPIPKDVLTSVMGFIFVYALAFATLSMMLAVLGLDFVTALSASASAISNVGPGLGDLIGPGGTFAPLPDLAKILLAGGMLFGRLEMFILLVVFVPSFWRD
ncbi:TrkH family potassium uptake protein [Magnetospirillum gryphiswaldense]|uniref:Trk system potassium uptake protein n=2 Tax=Magnetospirillum gryphiswaldense TaxID=55518 RepID=V6F8K4_MAGGM|nr:TrkH family potassium uptake protein [Magnetospirillum gryphiswaldense]AVM75062.1 Trk system potassium uptake protein TrkH [Magnetospirillum gryphiswaldense MSR-1]AVM78965.1 Trk system potassium uptake protein TrkH [Magnetospirillum gryphiswaldense]CAM76087.1 Trk system potassium uptake protein [Magnetospirillum gryphiswaldense MSR-1]CDL01048.1 Trk system potassium uptake protein [Magnetospirillum gryphiswaldense MSR-1 v2]